ncbi:MAG: hypothetical protein KF745_09825 [Phycisphaeraceae bacterium]|nr:hypothetical protein [Phycisphaeraceae bacterium]
MCFSEAREGGLKAIAGLRVLLVEDSYLAARSLLDMAAQAGVEVIGPAPTIESALKAVEEQKPEAAILDINLAGRSVEPVARRLDELGVPFFFVSGYNSPRFLDPHYQNHRRLNKPVEFRALARAMREEFAQ